MAKINLKVLTDITQSKTQLEALKNSVESISKSLSSVSVNPKLTAQINALTKHYNAVVKAAEKVAKVNYNNEIQAQKLAKATAQANKALADEATAIEKSKTQFAKHQKAVNDDTRAQEKHEAQMKKSTAQAEKATDASQKHSQSVASMIPNILKWQVAMTAVMLPLRKLQELLDSVNETLENTEKRIVSIRRVAGQSVNANELYALAQKYGQTFDNVADTVENFAKSGYTWEESLKAAEAALIAMNVAELDAQQSSEGLIAVMKQYKMEIKDLDYIINILNKTADTSAVSTEELLIALQKTGSTADNANISLEETIGLISALSEGTAASGQNIGNALRSLIVFTSDSKALDQFAGLSDNMEKTVKNYRAGQASILDVWQGLGTELQGMGSQKGTLEDLFGGAEMSADIEAQLTQITDSFAEIYGTAGNYRQNYFIALLNNIKDVQKATDEMKKANGYSQAENLEYLGTYEAKVTALEAKWQEMANDEQGILKFKKEMADLALVGLDAVDKVGGIRTVAIALGGALLSILVPAMKVANLKLKELGITASTSIGVISLVVTIISALIGKYQQYREEIRQVNQETVSAWQSNQDYAASLNDLYNKITNLDVASESYAETEKKLADLLGDKANSLDSVTKGTDEYKKAIESLTKSELDRLKLKQEEARIAAEINLLQSTDFVTRLTGAILDSDGVFSQIADFFAQRNVFDDLGISPELPGSWGDVDGILANYDYLLGLKNSLVERLPNITDPGLKEDYQSVYEELAQTIASIEPYVTAYRSAVKTIEELTGLIAGNTNETANSLEKIYKGTSTFSKKELEDVLSKVEEIRNATKNTLEYEEKKKAVLEAEKALLDAQNNRTVRVLNEATGQWEWVSNEKDVESARENLEKARLALEDGFFIDVKNLFESGNQTTEDIFELMEKWFGEGGGTPATEKLLELLGINQNWGRWQNYEDVKNAGYGDWVLDENAYFAKTGTQEGYIDYLANAYTQIANRWGITPAYDNGGVLRGLGGIKATTNDEVVLDPSISKKLLSPVSNKQFDTFVNDLGLLFGVSKSVSSNGIIYTNGGGGVDSHDKHYNVNGVPIPIEAAGRYTISELFDVMNIIPNI